jgi:hypothetical protein
MLEVQQQGATREDSHSALRREWREAGHLRSLEMGCASMCELCGGSFFDWKENKVACPNGQKAGKE